MDYKKEMNAAMQPESGLLVDAGLLATLWELALATRLEMCLFVAAVLAYFALFGNVMPKNAKQKNARLKAKQLAAEDDLDAAAHGQPLEPKEREQAEKAFKNAFDHGDHRSVVRQWNMLKRAKTLPSVSIPHAIESMQRVKKEPQSIQRELKTHFKKYPELGMPAMNDVLDSLSKRMDSDVMESISDMLPSLGLQRDERTYEIFLSVHFATRHFQEVQKVVDDMKTKKVAFTTRATIVVIKLALKTGNFEEAKSCFREMKAAWAGLSATPSSAPKHIVSQLVELACKEHQLREFLPELSGAPISDESLGMMLNECIWQKDATLTHDVEKLARGQSIPLTDRMYSFLLKGYASDVTHAKRIYDESLTRNTDISTELALAALGFCTQTSDIERAEKLRKQVKSMVVTILTAFIRFYVDTEQYEKACDVYEQELKKISNSDADKPDAKRSLCLDARLERVLMNAALRCGRSTLATGLLDSSPSDVAKHIAMIRNCAAAGNLDGAVNVFETLKRNGTELNSVIYNTVIDACVECNSLKAAEEWMIRTKEASMADVVSYNTLIKAQLANGRFDKVRQLMAEMKKDGLQPNRVTFNELINAVVIKDSRSASRIAPDEIWSLIGEMQEAGVKPNQVTCSILMKSLNYYSRETDVMKTMDLINNMDEPMDEVLLSSVVEACVRIGKPDLVSTKLKQLQLKDNVSVNGSHTFGSLIKAYGFAKDMDGVWRCWKEMRSRHIKPTSVTLGCMVEAVVNNGDPEGAFELIHEMSDDAGCRDVLNSVIYCSVLKGFAREKKVERAFAVYEEMCTRKVELSIVTYNTLIDACARCARMDRVPNIVADMHRYNIKPNLITYSTMLKGHCQSGDVQTAFSLLNQMKTEARLKPDEIMYNSLLDGCAQSGLVDEGLRLLEEMKKQGVPPSNFTLSVLVKLMSRARRLDSAFDIVDKISAEYRFKPNVHVYTNLAQACISNRALGKGICVLERMIKEWVAPDNRTYSILIRASVQQNLADQAAGLLRGALGISGAPSFLQTQTAVCEKLDYALVNEALVGIADLDKELALPLMADIRQQKPRVRIEASTQRQLMTSGAGGQSQANRGGDWRSGGNDRRGGSGYGNRDGGAARGGGYGNGRTGGGRD